MVYLGRLFIWQAGVRGYRDRLLLKATAEVAAETMVKFGEDARTAAEELTKLLLSHQPEVCLRVLRLVGKLGSVGVVTFPARRQGYDFSTTVVVEHIAGLQLRGSGGAVAEFTVPPQVEIRGPKLGPAFLFVRRRRSLCKT